MTPLQIATRRHREADMLVAGAYGSVSDTGFRGCSIGCLAHDLRPEWNAHSIGVRGHALVADHYGYPEWLVRLQDRLFERLPHEDRRDWHVQIADAIASRTREWKIVLHAVHAAILRVACRSAGDSAEVVQAVLDLHERAARGETIAPDDWIAARSAARSAVRSAGRGAAWSAAQIAARSADRGAARSAEWIATESAAYQEMRDGILAEVAR